MKRDSTIAVAFHAKAVAVMLYFMQPLRPSRNLGSPRRDAELKRLKHVSWDKHSPQFCESFATNRSSKRHSEVDHAGWSGPPDGWCPDSSRFGPFCSWVESGPGVEGNQLWRASRIFQEWIWPNSKR